MSKIVPTHILNLDKVDCRTKWSLKDFEIGGKIGRGQFGKVYSVRERRTGLGVIFALKVIKIDVITENNCEENVIAEMNIHKSLEHPNIIRFHGSFFDAKHLYFILDYANGSLFGLMYGQDQTSLDQSDVPKYAKQVAEGLHYMHSLGVVHLDLKPENILVGVDGLMKISDFGYAKRVAEKYDKAQSVVCLNRSIAGTPAYLCPEIINKQIYEGFKVDSWCLGVLIYEMVFAKTPFSDEDKVRDKFDFPKGANKHCEELISELLKANPDDRMELKDVLKNEWLIQTI